MKFSNEAINETTLIGEDFSGTDFSIDTESLGILFKGFSDSLYSDKIGSVVREIASNCFDAHKEVNQTDPVQINLKTYDPVTGHGEIIFEDFGPGLSPDRIKNIYSKYFASSKRDTNDEIGGFGIGAKSPLSYTSSFRVVTRVNSVEYDYAIHRGEKVPRIELISKKSTKERNGTKVIIPIEDTTDSNLFLDALKDQLKYFDNIDYNVSSIDNDYKIFQGKHWIHRSGSGNNKNNRTEICIGKVRYPLDTTLVFKEYEAKSGMKHPYRFTYNGASNIALKFDIGELSVTMNREAVEYNKTTIRTIQNRWEEASEELLELSKKYSKVDDLLIFQKSETKHSIPVSTDCILSDNVILPTIKPIYTPLLDDGINLNNVRDGIFFYLKAFRTKGLTTKSNGYYNITSTILNDDNIVFRLKDKYNERKAKYLYESYGGFLTVKQKDIVNSHARKDTIAIYAIANFLGIKEDDPELDKKWEIYKKHSLKLLVKHTKSFDKVVIPDTWVDSNSSIRVQRNETEIPYKLCQVWEKESPNFIMKDGKVSEIISKDSLTIYGGNNDDLKLKSLYALLDNPVKIHRMNVYQIIKISKSRFKHFEKHSKTIHVDEFIRKRSQFLRERIIVVNYFFKNIAKPTNGVYNQFKGKVHEKYYEYSLIASLYEKHSKFISTLKGRHIAYPDECQGILDGCKKYNSLGEVLGLNVELDQFFMQDKKTEKFFSAKDLFEYYDEFIKNYPLILYAMDRCLQNDLTTYIDAIPFGKTIKQYN